MKLYFSVDNTEKANAIFDKIDSNIYSTVSNSMDSDVIVVIGGDGYFLQCLHRYKNANKKLYGINAGHRGFLLNRFDDKDSLVNKINKAEEVHLAPLSMWARKYLTKELICNVAFNDVVIQRKTNQSSKLMVKVGEDVRIAELVGDGLIVSTPAGSTAYCKSAGGPILPINSKLFAMVSICPYYPKWNYAVLPDDLEIEITVLEPHKRPVEVVSDTTSVIGISNVIIKKEDVTVPVLFDKNKKSNRYVDAQFEGFDDQFRDTKPKYI